MKRTQNVYELEFHLFIELARFFYVKNYSILISTFYAKSKWDNDCKHVFINRDPLYN